MTEIRSYRSVFDLDRRIYRVDRLRLNPSGVPLRGIVYFLAILTMTLLADSLPMIGVLVRLLPWYIRDVALPGATSALLTLITVEGRPFHLATVALLRYAIGPRELAGVRPRAAADRCWRPDDLIVLVDGSDSRLRRLRYTGPGGVLVSIAHVRSTWYPGSFGHLARRPSITLAELPGSPPPARGQVIALTKRARLEVRR
jgi:hypothetical protein